MLAGFFAALAILTNLQDVASAVSAGDTNARFDVVGVVTDVNRSKSALFAMKTTAGCSITGLL